MFCGESLGKTQRRCRSFSEQVGPRPRIILLDSLPDKQSSCSFSRGNKGAIYKFELRKHRQNNQIMMRRRTTRRDVEKSKNRRKQNLEDEANNMPLDKEDTQRSNLNSKYL